MKKVLVTTPSFGKFNPNIFQLLKNNGCSVERIVPFSKEILLDEIEDADALIVGLETIDDEVLYKAKKLTIISKHGVGVDNIDLISAKKLGIQVANSPGTNTQAVADLTFGLMLSLARFIPLANETTKDGKWLRYDGRSVWGKKLGIIGLGAIGKAVAKRAKGFCMEILGHDLIMPSREETGVIASSLEDILVESDFITLHVPLNSETKGMIGEKELSLMKSSSFIINTSRGGVIDEKALYKVLIENKIAGAGIDAFVNEPPRDSPLLKLERVVATPHMGAFTVESNILTSELAAENVLKALRGENVLNSIDSLRANN